MQIPKFVKSWFSNHKKKTKAIQTIPDTLQSLIVLYYT